MGGKGNSGYSSYPIAVLLDASDRSAGKSKGRLVDAWDYRAGRVSAVFHGNYAGAHDDRASWHYKHLHVPAVEENGISGGLLHSKPVLCRCLYTDTIGGRPCLILIQRWKN